MQADRGQAPLDEARDPPAARPRFRGPKATSRSTDRSNSCSSGFWKTNPTVAASSATVRPRFGAVDRDPALGRSQQPVEVLDERGLARAVLADDRDGLAGSIVSETPRSASTPFG